MKINIRDLEAAYRALNLEGFIAYFEEMTRRLEEIANVDSYQGRTARRMKSYFKEVHGLVNKSFMILAMEIDTSLNRFRNNFRQIDDADNAIITRDYLHHLQSVIDQYRRSLLQDDEEIENEIRRANAWVPGVTSLINVKDAEGSLVHGSRYLNQLMDQLEGLDQHELRQIETIESHLHALIEAIRHIEAAFSGNIENFMPGSFSASALGKSLFEHMINSAVHMANNGSTNEALIALSIIGGYISTLPPHLRRIFEQLKGRTLQCALVGDPVNAATGNFIYDNTDISIGGPYGLEFKRFYNSVDAHDGVLGRNWCHHYEIRLSREEEGIVSILYGDGHRAYYEPYEGGNEALESGYRSSLGVFDVLKKLEEDYELTLRDGGKYHFNGLGQLTHQVDPHGNKTTLSYDDDLLQRVETKGGYLTFSYANDRISEVTDHTGRSVGYEYEGGMLTKYIDVLGNCYTYEYDDRQRLLKETKPEGAIGYENTYDNNDRVARQTFADGSEMGYRYWSNRTDFIWQNGTKITYKRDEQYRTTGVVYPDGEEVIEYNTNNQRSKFIDKLGNETSFGYDRFGNLTRVTNALGVVTEFEYEENSDRLVSIKIDGDEQVQNVYDDAGNLIMMKDALDQEIMIGYTKEHLPSTITQADGSKVELMYDDRGNVVRVKDATGVMTEYRYDQLGRVIGTVDGNKNETSFVYDVSGNITAVKNAEGNSQTFEYNKNNKVVKVTDFNNAVIQREYNELGKLSKVIDPLDRSTSFAYDVMWNIAKVTEANGAETEFIYNEMNRLETVVKPDGSKIYYAWDANGNRIGIADELRNITKLKYDAVGQLIEVSGEEGLKYAYTYNSFGKVVSVVDGVGNVVNLEYNVLGQLVKETNVLGDSRVYTYTSLGKVSTVIDEAGRVTKYEYELGGRLKGISHPDGTSESFAYDGNGNVETHTNKLGLATEYSYDSLNRVVSIEANGGTKTYEYDPVGNVVSMTDELGNVTEYEYSLTGQLAKVRDALGNETNYSYDLLDNLIEVRQEGTEVLGHDGVLDDVQKFNDENQGLRITKYHRNIMGQVTSVEDSLGNVEQYKYSPKGQLIENLDEDGFLTRYSYTKQGDVNHIQYADGKEVAMSYNALRQLTEICDWLGSTQIEVDPLGRATKVTDHNGEVVSYEYGKLGQRESITYPDGKKVSYSFDDALRLAQVNDGQQEISYHYDQFSRLTSKQFDDSARTEYGYNQLGQLESLKHFGKDGLTDSYKYQYDLLGNKTSIEKQRQGMEFDSGLFNYAYDPLNRLSEVTKDDNSLRSYSYDAFGNRVSMVENDNQITYNFNSLNQLISSDDMRYEYDKRGNMTEVYQNNQLINKHDFGALNRLEKSINHKTSLSSVYKYSGLGHRIGQTISNLDLNPVKEIEDVLDCTRGFHNLLQRIETGIDITSFIYDSSVLSAQSGNHSLNYFHDDLGSPIRLVDGAGLELDVFGYNEFGTPLHDNHNTNSIFSFTGYVTDPISSTLFAQAREYKPEIGRFVSQDLVKGIQTYPSTLNPYTYCWNDPMNLVDLDGNFPSLSDIGDWFRDIGDKINDGTRVLVDALTTSPATNILFAIGDRFYNDNAERVVNSSAISNYRGQIVIRWSPDGRPGSFGPIMLLPDGTNRDTLDVLLHENSHLQERRQLGFWRYYLGIGIPSFTSRMDGFYYNRPWERYTDYRAGVEDPRHTDEALALSQCYFAYLDSLGLKDWFGFLRSLNDIRNGDFSSFEGTCE